MKFTVRTRNMIHRRANGRCEKCGMPLPTALAQIHHRRPRGMGGTRRRESATASNGMYVHLACHMDIESNRQLALANGWLVQQTHEPVDVAVKLWNGWMMLDDEGWAQPVKQDESVNKMG
jgi:5-methylcytosine-specific restriction protein A